jgi:hypothetical protein
MSRDSRQLTVGTPVEVRSRFTREWSRGFEIAAVLPGGCTLRRMSDNSLLPVEFAFDEFRAHDSQDGHRRERT